MKQIATILPEIVRGTYIAFKNHHIVILIPYWKIYWGTAFGHQITASDGHFQAEIYVHRKIIIILL